MTSPYLSTMRARKALRHLQEAGTDLLAAYRHQPTTAGKVALVCAAALIREVTQQVKAGWSPPSPIVQVDSAGALVRMSI